MTQAHLECSEANLRALVGKLVEVTNPDRKVGRAAEEFLKNLESQTGYGVLLLRLLELEAVPCFQQSKPVPNHVLVAAITFKNYVRCNYNENGEHVIQEVEKVTIKQHLVELMLKTPQRVQRQLSEAVFLVSRVDFPHKWEGLLPALVISMRSGELPLMEGALTTAHAILQHYRNVYKSEAVLRELLYILPLLQEPLLLVFRQLIEQLPQAQGAVQRRIMLAVQSAVEIFHDLSAVDLPEHFEDHLKEWMEGFNHLFSFQTQSAHLLEDPSGSDEAPGALHCVQREVCEVYNLYCSRYEEEFKPFLDAVSQKVWETLTRLPNEPKYDTLVSAAILFLTSISKGVDHQLFASETTLKQVCESIVIPNLRFSDLDEENFEDNPVEYIRRDIEGSDGETRRRSACELVKGLRKHFEQQVTQIFSAYVNRMLEEYRGNPKEHWRSKDVALFLVTALTISRQTASHGATALNELVPLAGFLSGEVLPELESFPNNHAVVQADVLKFVTVFRAHVPEAAYGALLAVFAKMLRSDVYVVHTYAAHAIDRYLAMRRDGQPRIGDEWRTVLPGALSGCFALLEKGQSSSNEYVIRAVWRMLQRAKDAVVPLAKDVLDALSRVLLAVAKNPTNPNFNRYLFESLGSLIRNVGATSPAAVAQCEELLFPVFQHILTEDVAEFTPFVFQLMGLLLQLRPDGISPAYKTIFPNLLTGALWTRSGNVPGLVKLLQAYIAKSQGDLGDQLEPLLGVFKMLNARRAYDQEGFYLIESLVEHLPLERLSPFMEVALRLMLERLTGSRTQKYVRCFLIFCSLFMAKHNPEYLVTKLDSINAGLFGKVIENFWLPTVLQVVGKIERKMCAIGTIRLLCESPTYLAQYGQSWPQMLQRVLSLLELQAGDESADSGPGADEVEIDTQASGYSVAYAQLATACTDQPDPLASIAEPKAFLCQSLQTLTQARPGIFLQQIEALPQESKQVLQSYLQATGATLQ
jgi:exportin-2 (importin alpha re-exporter)